MDALEQMEQMDLMDISDQEALDVFLNSGSGAEEAALSSPIPGALFASEPTHCQNNDSIVYKRIRLIVWIGLSWQRS